MKLFQRLRAHLFKVTLTVVAALLIVQYWRRVALDSRPFDPFLINSKPKLEFISENGTILEGIDEYFNGSLSQNISAEFSTSRSTNKLCPPIPPNLVGKIKIRKKFEKFATVERDFDDLEPGGAFVPKECKARYVVALVIPYRDRPLQLAIFLNNIHRLLMRQQIEYRIFVVEQDGDYLFNRGKLLNVGFVEASKIRNFDCYIFHDVDLIPEDDRNLYTCPEQPRHMSVAVDKFSYRLPYKELFGGVCALSKEHFKLVNGFNNDFWGWGGEDDDLYSRVKSKGLNVTRYPPKIARYTMLPHVKQKPNPKRYEIMRRGKEAYDVDGLTNIQYTVKAIDLKKLYTWILVDLQPPSTWSMLEILRSWSS